MTTPAAIRSIGNAAVLLQADTRRIAAVAAALHISPAMRINGVDHFKESDLEKIRRKLALAKAKQ